MINRDGYSIVVAGNPIRNKLVVELSLMGHIDFEFYVEDNDIKLAIYTETGKEPIVTNAGVFNEAFQDALRDALTLPRVEDSNDMSK